MVIITPAEAARAPLGDTKTTTGTLLGELWPAIQAEQTPLVSFAAGKLEEEQAEEASGTGVQRNSTSPCLPQKYRRLAADWKLPAAPGPVQQVRSDPPDVRDYIEFRWAGEDARLTGNLVHRLLQLIAQKGLETWSAGGGMAAREDW